MLELTEMIRIVTSDFSGHNQDTYGFTAWWSLLCPITGRPKVSFLLQLLCLMVRHVLSTLLLKSKTSIGDEK